MIGDSEMQISLAKPPTENKLKEKRKQMHRMQFFHGWVRQTSHHSHLSLNLRLTCFPFLFQSLL